MKNTALDWLEDHGVVINSSAEPPGEPLLQFMPADVADGVYNCEWGCMSIRYRDGRLCNIRVRGGRAANIASWLERRLI